MRKKRPMYALLYFLMSTAPLDTVPKDSTFLTIIYNDSVSLYTKYKDDIAFLNSLRPEDTAQWGKSHRHKHTITCAQQKQLSQYNGTDYAPIDSFLRPGFEGYAYNYPKPSELKHIGMFVNTNAIGPKLRYIVYDKQVHFIVNREKKTTAPYIQKITFDKGRIILIEKLDPITKQKIP